MKKPAVYLFIAGIVAGDRVVLGSGHGPVFGLATPTNPKGGFSADLTLMGRAGQGRNGSMLRGSLGYGVTENFKLSISAPGRDHGRAARAVPDVSIHTDDRRY